MTTREALEAALVATPDDVALHCAYADYLIEQGDPRGEYIRLELLRDDRSLSSDDRDKVVRAANVIFKEQAPGWLGPLRPYTHGGARSLFPGFVFRFEWHRGWIHRMWFMPFDRSNPPPSPEVRPEVIRRLFAHVVTAPVARMLRMLYWYDHPLGCDGIPALAESGLVDRLNHLHLFAGDIDDDGAQRLADCPAVRRLWSLDLSGNQITDDGARSLVQRLAGAGLHHLGLSGNLLSPIGVDELRTSLSIKQLILTPQRFVPSGRQVE